MDLWAVQLELSLESFPDVISFVRQFLPVDLPF